MRVASILGAGKGGQVELDDFGQDFARLYPKVRFAHMLSRTTTTRLATSIPRMKILLALLRFMLMGPDEYAQ
ncbi:hypothetical protein FRC15_002514, partial [Serendipita sp. 397]